MTNQPNRIPRNFNDDYATARAIAYLNFALHLRISADDAIIIASDALDDDSNQLDITDAPLPTDARMMLLALANESFNSDDDFDDFLHELDHANNNCTDPDYCTE